MHIIFLNIWIALFFAFFLNPYIIGVIGLNAIGLVLIRGRKIKKWLKVSVTLFILSWFSFSVYYAQRLSSDNSTKSSVREIDNELYKPIVERSYYTGFKEFRDSLEVVSDIYSSMYTKIDSSMLNAYASIDNEFFSEFQTMSLEEYRKEKLSMKDRVERTFFSYVDRKNNKMYLNIYLPFVDSLYSILKEPKEFYIHSFKNRPSRDSVRWEMVIDYETTIKRDTAKAYYSFGDEKLIL